MVGQRFMRKSLSILSSSITLVMSMNAQVSIAADVEPMLAAGRHHSVLLNKDGTVWTSGYNAYGNLGNGDSISRSAFRIIDINDVVKIASNHQHNLALKSNGTVWAWGLNDHGELGNGTYANQPKPVQISINNVKALAAGTDHSLAVKNNGSVWAWGYNGYGQLGDGTNTQRNAPVQVSINNVIAVSAGQLHSVALKADGTVWAWGSNGHGQLGDNTQTNSSAPIKAQISDVKAIATGEFYTLAIKNDGSLWAWGYNAYGQLCDGTTIGKNKPTKVDIDNVQAVDGGGYDGYGTTIILKEDNSIWGCGYNENGELGIGNNTTKYYSPTQIALYDRQMIAIAASSHHGLALDSDGLLWAWGRNANGELGDGTFQNRYIPMPILNLGGNITVNNGNDDGGDNNNNGNDDGGDNNNNGNDDGNIDNSIPTDPTICNERAVYSAEDKKLTVPVIEIPVYSPINGEIVGTETFSARFKYIGFDYLQLESIANLADGIDSNSPCRARYGYEGQGYIIPFVDIQTVVGGNGNLVGPVMTFQVRMPWNELRNMYRVEKVIQLD